MLPCFSPRPPPSPIGRRPLRFVSAISMSVATTLVSAAPTIFLPDFHPQPNVQIAVEQSRDAQTKAALTTPSTSTLVVLRDETIASAIVPASGKALSDLANKDIVDENARRLNAALASPSKVRLLIVERPDDDFVKALKPGFPEHRLLNYV